MMNPQQVPTLTQSRIQWYSLVAYNRTQILKNFQRLDLHQKQFEFHFTVGKLEALLSKGNAAGAEAPLAALVLERFGLDFALAKFDMKIGVSLGYALTIYNCSHILTFCSSLSMNYLEAGHDPTAFISSETSTQQDLVKVKYTRVQPESPEFASLYESINQSVDVDFSTIVLRAQPEPVVAMYDFMMSTFVSPTPAVAPAVATSNQELIVLPTEPTPAEAQSSTEQIRVNINLQGVGGNFFFNHILVNI